MFVEQMKNVLNEDYNESITENRMVGYKTQGSKLVDCNFAVSSMRHMSEQEIVNKFMDAYYENPKLAMKWLFYVRDVREGLGERRSFRLIMQYIAENNQDVAMSVIDLIPEYGRWDDLVELIECNNANISNEVIDIIHFQLEEDKRNIKENKSISLLGKWLPSINASSKDTIRRGKYIANALGYTPKQYRKLLSELRKHINVVECKMSAKQWNEIDYSKVPSKANINYNNAFLRNDTERRQAFLEGLKKGETKINASVLFPHDVVHKYCNTSSWNCMINPYDETLEQLWKSLKDMGNINNTIVVADGSGSMTCQVDNKSSVTALDVANALAIYCGERCSGEFKDKYITFSHRPQLVDFTNAKSLKEKIEIALRYSEVADTNIKAVFDLILTTAKNNNMSQEEIPQNILIISDMEFNGCVNIDNWDRPTPKFFEQIKQEYNEAGYKLPRLVFWNVNSRTNTIPIRQNELGVALVSGFSVNVLNMVMSGELDPYKCLVNELNRDRYMPIEEALVGII